MPTKSNKKLFINKSKQVHGDKYDYSKVEYINAYTKVCIICPEHGEFWQTPASHMKGYGCLKCGQIERKKKLVEINQKKYNTDAFIKDARKIHGDKYDYSKVEYVNATTKVCIICPEHGEFWQTPNMHLNASQGCPKCAKNHSITQEEFMKAIEKSFLEKLPEGTNQDRAMDNLTVEELFDIFSSIERESDKEEQSSEQGLNSTKLERLETEQENLINVYNNSKEALEQLKENKLQHSKGKIENEK